MTVVATRGTTNRNDRGSARDRRRRKEWLLVQSGLWRTTPGGARRRVAPCWRCRRLLDYNALTVDRIVPGCRGGTYRRDNIRPACGPCNSETGGALRRLPAT